MTTLKILKLPKQMYGHNKKKAPKLVLSRLKSLIPQDPDLFIKIVWI